MEVIRSFIAFDLENEKTRDALREFGSRLKKNQKRLSLVNPDILHITVKFIGDIKESLAPKVYNVLEEEINKAYFKDGPREYILEGVGQFSNFGVIWAMLKGEIKVLQDIKDIVESQLDERLDIKKDKRPKFQPHLTIARLRKNKIDYKTFDSFKTIIKQNKDLTFGKFTIKQIKLKKSVLTPKGPIYSDLVY